MFKWDEVGVINKLRICSGFELDLSFVLFFRIAAFSVVEHKDSFSSLGFSDLCPSWNALVIDTDDPR